MKNKGFSLIEVIIAITILSLIVSGLSYVFAIPLASVVPVEMKLLAYSYSQKEMEMIVNSSFNNSFGKPRQTYPLDNKFQYEIIEDHGGDINLKTITIHFFNASSLAQISEIYSIIRNLYIDTPTITANLVPNPINWGQSSVLSWTTTNATSLTILPGIGNIPSGEVASGSRTVSPLNTTDYTLDATGPGGTSSTTIRLTVLPPGVPTISASLNPTMINPGQSSVLSWTTTLATSLTISPGIGSIPLGEVALGSRTVSPLTTTTYTLTATGPGGSSSVNITLTVGYLETFDDGNYLVPTFGWTNNPSGQWSIINFSGSPASRYNRTDTQEGTSYPSINWSSPSNNYIVEGRVYLNRDAGDSALTPSYAAIGGRSTTGGSGYFVRIDVEPSTSPVRTRVMLMSTNTALLTAYYPGVLYFNQWVTLRLEMIGTSISYYFNGQLLGTVLNNTAFTTGRPFLRASAQRGGAVLRDIYFDDIKIEFR